MAKEVKTVLISPFEWGLGHAARLVPVIRACRERGWKVLIAADGKPLDFLRGIFPDLPWVVLPFTIIKYSRKDNFMSSLIPQLPGIIRAVRKNHRQITEMVELHGIDYIIGDHQYGLSHHRIPSVFISNQIWLLAPKGWHFAEKWIYRVHKRILRNFTFLWLADFPGEINFSGKQTHLPESLGNVRFIGPISRFIEIKKSPASPKLKPKILLILSGPEPQRSILENKIAKILLHNKVEAVILRGLPPSVGKPIPPPRREENLLWMDHADDAALVQLIHSAEKIICRPGLSMLSDLVTLGKTALLVPTPGQTEQNYMAEKLYSNSHFAYVNQKDLSMEIIDSFQPEKYKLFPGPDLSALNIALDELASK